MRSRYGAPSEVVRPQTIPTPTLGADDVLVRVRAAGVNPADVLTTRGWPYLARVAYGLRAPRQRVPGLDLAGEVEAIGANVTGVRIGNPVFGWGTGAFAELAAIPASSLAPKPSILTFDQAAAVPTAGFAALQALRHGRGLESGLHVLVVGASGGVGTLAVQLAKALGSEVTGVCSTRNVGLVRSVGADHVVDYTRQELGARGRRYDVILDLAGGRPLAELRRVLAPGGTLVVVGGANPRSPSGMSRFLRAAVLSLFVRQRLRPLLSSPSTDDLAFLARLLTIGKLRPVIDRHYPLEAAADALHYVEAGRARGKVVLDV